MVPVDCERRERERVADDYVLVPRGEVEARTVRRTERRECGGREADVEALLERLLC